MGLAFSTLAGLPRSNIVAPQVLGSTAVMAAPVAVASLESGFTVSDARSLIVKKYLRRYGSPLEPFAQYLVDTADKYNLDYRLLPAIAQQESNLCKKIPEDSHNCWGFGIYGNKVTRFDSYAQAIDTVARTLKKKYIDQGLDTPEEMMAKYTPPSVEKGGPWAKAVNQFLADLE
ncbi:MAG: hypothetical protein G01um101413_968 [Parcubacteria group bacterium Gr01-1014_13]|nr:MAG: hypothetical protein G01um101413_968 [Parcubacteria group bacterium Gr01-1014_13]